MTINSIGDNARAFSMQNATNRLKSTLNVLSSELNSGKVADITQRVRGNLQPLHHIENKISLLGQFKLTSAEATSQADLMQNVLTEIHAKSEKLGITLITDFSAPSAQIVSGYARDAKLALQSVVSQLNSSVAGVRIFGGTEVNRAPLVSANAILAEAAEVVSGAATPTEVFSKLDDWFSAPAGGDGFLDFAYSGSQGKIRQVQVSEHDMAVIDIDASHNVLRETLKSLVMGSLAENEVLPASIEDRRELLRLAGDGLHENGPRLIGLRGKVGLMQQQIEVAQAQNAHVLSSFQVARNDMVAADPFATAAAITEVQTQMETLYTLTARLSNLKLVDYLR
ncbi:MAG: flagellin [Paracoccus sp. (in: a-proteobacteria)]|nr:flagellin [Paracoccus sp. (in: a-proteobacteria)]